MRLSGASMHGDGGIFVGGCGEKGERSPRSGIRVLGWRSTVGICMRRERKG